MRSLSHPDDALDLLRRIATIRADSRRRWGRMTAPQMVGHLAGSYRMALGDKPVRPVTRGVRAALIKALALYVPWPWPAGRVRTVPELDQAVNPCIGADFDAEIAALRGLLQRLASSPTISPTHPIFGRMSRRDWMRWAYLHTDHHLRQFGA